MRSNFSGGGFNNSEYRSYNRGYGRGYSKPYRKPHRPHSPEPTRKGDVFIEAGKLAVEYLISNGILSSNVLTGKYQNGTSRNASRELKPHRDTPDKEIPSSPVKELDLRRQHRSHSLDYSQENGKETDNHNGPKDASKDIVTDVQMSQSVESSDNDDGDKNQMNEKMDVDSDLKMASVSQVNDDGEPEKCSGGVHTEDGTGKADSDKETNTDDLDNNDKCDPLSNNTADLLKLCGSEKIPTRIRSSLVPKKPKNDTGDIGCDTVEATKEAVIDGDSEIPTADCVNEQNPSEPLSLTDKTVSFEGKSTELSELKGASSSDKDRGEKRGFMDQIGEEGIKKAKQWLSVSQSGDYTQLSDVTEKPSVFNGSNQVEKQFFSSTFRICDLNLMGSSDIHENRDVPSLLYPSSSSKDAHVGVDLAMNSSGGLNDMFNNSGSVRKGVEIIDLESESQSLQDGKTTPPNMEVGMTNVGNFPNNSQNPTDNPDSQNGYSFMISELLGNDDPNCSSVQPDMNSLQNDIGLHHGEVMFSEDDSIYMSLGEIPISILRAWDQPNQERNPFGL